MGFKCMKFKANFVSQMKKAKPPQVVCLKYTATSEFDNLSTPLPTNNISNKPIKSKPTTQNPEFISIFNDPPKLTKETKLESTPIKPAEPLTSISKEPKSYDETKVELPSITITQEPDYSNPLITYATENQIETDDNQVGVLPLYTTDQEEVPISSEQEKVPPFFTTEQEEVPPLFTTEQEEVPSSFATEQKEVPPSFTTAQKEVPSPFTIEQEEVPPTFITEQEEVPSSIAITQEEVPSPFTIEQEEVTLSFTDEQEEIPPSHTSEQAESLFSYNSEQKEILSKEEQEEIISSDGTAENSPYKVRFAKKPKPNYELKPNDESEISDYESDDDDFDFTDDNNNQEPYSSQAASIFFEGVEAEPAQRIKKFPKDDDEV